MIRFVKFIFSLIFKLVILAFVGAGVAGMIWGPQEMIEKIMGKQKKKDTSVEDITYFTARRETLQIGLTERGSLRAIKTVGVFIRQSRRMKFQWIETEGKLVKKGDVITKFETEEFKDQITEKEKNLAQLKENLEVAKKEIGITKSTGELSVAKAESTLEDAIEALKKHRQLDAPKKLKEFSTKMKEARRKLDEAIDKRSEKQSVIDDQKYSGDEELEAALKELEEAEYEVKTLRQKVKDASLDKKLYQTYDYKKELRNKRDALANAKLSLTKERIRSTNKLAQKKAEVRKSEDSIKRVEKEIKELNESLDACEVKAPVDGRLLYGDSKNGWPPKSQITIGKNMWGGVNFLTIPDESTFEIDAYIAEEYRHKIKEGVPAKITVEAIPELQIEGKVNKIESFAKENNGGPKTYKTQISMENSDPRMVSGMTVTVEIIAETIENALIVPVEAVFNEEDKTVCFVRKGNKNEKRVVKTRKSNDDFVEIVEGLKEGEEVSLLSAEFTSSQAGTKSETKAKEETPQD